MNDADIRAIMDERDGLRAELAKAEEENARIRAQLTYYSGWDERMSELETTRQRLLEENARLRKSGEHNDNLWRDKHDRLQVALGRAVEALRWTYLGWHRASVCEHDWCKEARAILDDPMCAAAGEYVAALNATIDSHIAELAILRRLESAVFAGDAAACSPEVPRIMTEYLEWSRAAVDARKVPR